MEAYLAILLAPDEATEDHDAVRRERFVADASVETSRKICTRPRSSYLEAEQEPVIEHCRVVDAVGVAIRVSLGRTDRAIDTVGVVAGEAGDFQAEHDADVSETDFRARRRSRCVRQRPIRKAQIFIITVTCEKTIRFGCAEARAY